MHLGEDWELPLSGLGQKIGSPSSTPITSKPVSGAVTSGWQLTTTRGHEPGFRSLFSICSALGASIRSAGGWWRAPIPKRPRPYRNRASAPHRALAVGALVGAQAVALSNRAACFAKAGGSGAALRHPRMSETSERAESPRSAISWDPWKTPEPPRRRPLTLRDSARVRGRGARSPARESTAHRSSLRSFDLTGRGLGGKRALAFFALLGRFEVVALTAACMLPHQQRNVSRTWARVGFAAQNLGQDTLLSSTLRFGF